MTTKEIANILELTARLMELHGENPFKIKALQNAAFKLSKTRMDLAGKSDEEIESIEGIGKGITSKIHEILLTGTTDELEQLREKTPEGILEMLEVKGIGPKKVKQLWNELGIESIIELLYACNENRLIDLKGFGEKTQEGIKQNIEFSLKNSAFFHYAAIESSANNLINFLRTNNAGTKFEFSGDFRRKCEIIDKIIIVCNSEKIAKQEEAVKCCPLPVEFVFCSEENFTNVLFETTGSGNFLRKIGYTNSTYTHHKNETEIFDSLCLQYFEPELREENEYVLTAAKENRIPELITLSDIKGVLHSHSSYSDGLNTLSEMARYCQQKGYEYLGICDHSQSAYYASGLKPDEVIKQQKEIDQLNKALAPFKILKGIESDILNNGNLDYDDDLLQTFDFVVASVHSNLKMNEEKATQRIIKAIENPFTSILGHPTGRLLLARKGYPLNHKKIIDACAANQVVIELNSHPYRLDIDWRWIPYCIEKGVMISINPDAHQKEGIHDIQYGIHAARKGMLSKNNCLNALSLSEIENYFLIRKVRKN